VGSFASEKTRRPTPKLGSERLPRSSKNVSSAGTTAAHLLFSAMLPEPSRAMTM
jgi:hypothetical protein